MRGKSIMLQGTGSSVGKSMLSAALCRVFRQDGLRVAPFKSQNMALNSFATREGLEMGRAQVVQAQAAGVEPSVAMNPILLKPTSDKKSQVIVLGRPIGNMSAVEYHRYKPNLRAMVKRTYDELEARYDAVVIEGAGSPAEINLREGDLVNMWMAEAADAPVLLVGDIDRGGVFAALYGTVMLLEPEERERVKGLVINKFRGDVSILEPGLRMIEEKLGIPVVGVVPWTDADIEDEDSVSRRLTDSSGAGEITVAVVRLKHLSNFTDFQALSLHPGVTLKYASRRSPVASSIYSPLPFSISSSHIFEVRRHCQTMALHTGLPDFFSQTTVVSRWLVMPIPAISSGDMPLFATHSVIAAYWLA